MLSGTSGALGVELFAGHIPRVVWRLPSFAIMGVIECTGTFAGSCGVVRVFSRQPSIGRVTETQRRRDGAPVGIRRGCCFPGASKGGPGNQNGNHKHAVRWRATALYGASSEGG